MIDKKRLEEIEERVASVRTPILHKHPPDGRMFVSLFDAAGEWYGILDKHIAFVSCADSDIKLLLEEVKRLQALVPKFDTETKRWLVFAYDKYDASGGLGDNVGDFDTLEEAKRHAKDYSKCDCLEIWDRIDDVYHDLKEE